eukprot:gene22640-29788_t
MRSQLEDLRIRFDNLLNRIGTCERVSIVVDRLQSINLRLDALDEQAEIHEETVRIMSSQLEDLRIRFDNLLNRIGTCERVSIVVDRLQSINLRLDALDEQAEIHEVPRQTEVTEGASATQQRLERELIDKAFSLFKFVRVPGGYYGEPLEYRMGILQAGSIHHLCKSMIMHNAKVDKHPGFAEPSSSKYVLVVVQYSARLDTKKLRALWNKLGGCKKGLNQYDFRLAPSEVSDSMSGFLHNAVTPVGIACPGIPIVLSHQIASLAPSVFWMGGGEVDLKLGLKASEFVEKYNAIVANVTEDNAIGVKLELFVSGGFFSARTIKLLQRQLKMLKLLACVFMVTMTSVTSNRLGARLHASNARSILQGASAEALAQAIAQGDSSAAAKAIAEASAQGGDALASALALASAFGDSTALAEAISQALAEGADATAVSEGVAIATGGRIPEDAAPAGETPAAGDSSAVASALAESFGGSVTASAQANSAAISESVESTSVAVTQAIAEICGGGDASATAQSLAKAVATATATAVAKASATVTVEGNGQGCADASATSTAVATAVARAIAEAFASATNGCAEAIAQTRAEAFETKIARATATASASACSSGGTASADAEAIATAVATATAEAFASALAAVQGDCTCPGGPEATPTAGVPPDLATDGGDSPDTGGDDPPTRDGGDFFSRFGDIGFSNSAFSECFGITNTRCCTENPGDTCDKSAPAKQTRLLRHQGSDAMTISIVSKKL